MPDNPIDIANADLLLSTTRSVRKRLDLERPVPREVILECVRHGGAGADRQQRPGLAVDDRHRPREARRALRALRQHRPAVPGGGRERGDGQRRADDPRLQVGALPPRRARPGAGARHPVHRGPREHRGQHLGRELLRIDHAGELELHARPARPRPRVGLDHAAPPARAGSRRAARDPVRVGEPDRAAPGRVHGRHRLQARGPRPGRGDHLLGRVGQS